MPKFKSHALIVAIIFSTLPYHLAYSQIGERLCDQTTVPTGAAELGFTKKIINLCPTVADIASNKIELNNLYSGLWYQKSPLPKDAYKPPQKKDGISVPLGGDLATVKQDSTPGKLPLLSGEKGFYVEFEVSLTENDPDHWPAVWLLPIEHNIRQEDHFDNDPPKFERWMELDVDEGGFGPGLAGTVISWTGIWPEYRRKMNNHNKISSKSLDRKKTHIFAASYSPELKKVRWWLDNEFQMEATSPYVPDIAKSHNYYMIISAQSHKKNTPYHLNLYSFRAFTKP